MNQKYLLTHVPEQKTTFITADAVNIAAWLLRNSDRPVVRLLTGHSEPFLTARNGLIETCGDETFLTEQLLPADVAMQTGNLKPPAEIAYASIEELRAEPPMPDWNCLKALGVPDAIYFSACSAQQEAEAAGLDR